MAKFIVRVELHSATETDYANLHSKMAAEGFSRTIVADNGIKYQLPTAEYKGEGNVTVSTALAAAQRAAKATGRSADVIVAEYISASWALPVAS
jgi:hypothetical protein